MLTTVTPCCCALREHGHERARIGGGNHDGIHALGQHLLDERHLLRDVALVPDAVDDEVVLAGARGLVLPRAVGHGDEELVGERLHHERDARTRDRAGGSSGR